MCEVAMRVFSIEIKNKMSDVCTKMSHTMRIGDEIVDFKFGFADTTNEDLVAYIKENMRMHLIVKEKEIAAPSVVSEPEVEEDPVVVEDVQPKRKRRRKYKK
jgi:hypothetical protein